MGQQHVLNFPTIAWALFTSTLFGIYGSAPFLIPLWFLYMVLFFLIRRLHYARKGRANKHSVAQIIVKSMLFFIVLQYFVILACFVIDCGILYDDPMRWQTSKFANWPVFVVSRFYNFAFPNTKGFFSLTWTPFGLLPFAVIQIDLLGWALLGVASGSLTSLILKWRNRNA
jgi:hypothetical protein